MRVKLSLSLIFTMVVAAIPSPAAGADTAARRGLGVTVKAVDDETAGNLGLDAPRGALVVEVTPGSAGAGAGILPNDLILTVDGRPVAQAGDLAAAAAAADPTRWVEIGVWRRGTELTVYAFLGPGAPPGARPEASKKAKPKIAVSGYVQTHFFHSSDTNGDDEVSPDRFRVLRVRIMFKGAINPHVSYDVEIDPRAPAHQGLMRDAFITLNYIPHQDIRIGQQKTQFGFENDISSSRLYYVNRSELSDSLMRGINLRDIGIGLIGHVPLGGGFRFEDAVTLVNGNGFNPPGTDDNNNRKNVWGRLGGRYHRKSTDLTIRLGLSGANGNQLDEGNDPVDPNDDFTVEFERLGADLEIDQKWFFLATEYAKGWDSAGGSTDVTHGYYVTLAGKTPWRVGPMVRYDTLDAEFRRWTFGAYYGLPEDDVRVLLNFERRKLEDEEPGDDRYYLQLQVRF